MKEFNILRFVYFIEKLFYSRRVVTVNEDHYGVKEIDGKLNLCSVYMNELGEYVFLPISVDVSDLVNLIADNCFTDNGKIENDEFIEGIKMWEATQKDCFDDFKKACEGEF